MKREITQQVSIIPHKVEREGNGIVITDEQGDVVIINLNWENTEFDEKKRSEKKVANDKFVEIAEEFHSDSYRYHEW